MCVGEGLLFRYWPFAKRLLIKSGSPLQLIFFVTARCNANCRHCFYWSRLNAPGHELSLAEIEKLSAGLPSLLWLSLTGGEPFLRNDLPEIAATFCRHSQVRMLTLPTNGLLTGRIVSFTRQILDSCPQTQIIVSISIDGFPQTHDRIRQVPGGFERARDTFMELKQLKRDYANFSLIVTITCSPFNQQELVDLYCFLRDELQPDNIGVGMLRGNPRETTDEAIDLSYYRKLNSLYQHDLQTGALPYYRSPLGKLLAARELLVREFVARTVEEKRALLPCFAGTLSAVVSEEGEVRPCEILEQGFGYLSDYQFDFARLWNSPPAQQIRTAIRAGCFCTYECAMTTNILFNPCHYPALLSRAWHLM